MALPEQIRKQTEAVQELYKQLNVDQEQGAESPADVPDTVQADGTEASNDAAPSPAPEQMSGDATATEDFAQKYKTLQGMYNAEVPRLHQQNRELAQRVQQMEQLLATLSAQPVLNQPQSQPEPAQQKLVTEKDVEEYGESIDVMRKVSREELSAAMQRVAQLEAALKQLQTNVVPQVQAVAQKQAVSAEQQFWSALTSTVPNWREVNDNSSFQSWLLEADPLTGITRQTYLEDAQRALDARRVSAFFRTWLESTGQAVAQPQGSVPVSQNPELEKQVTPGRARSAGTPQTNKGKVYTPDDIKKFFNDVRAGKFKGREQERDRIERDIFTAQRENRIQVNA